MVYCTDNSFTALEQFAIIRGVDQITKEDKPIRQTYLVSLWMLNSFLRVLRRKLNAHCA